MERKPTDLCLLCKIRPATKKNSHLISKFLTSNMMRNSKRRRLLASNALKGIRSKPVQETVVENYILCPECESRLGKIERYIANKFYNRYANPAYASDFMKSVDFGSARTKMRLNLVDLQVMRLFAYSILWRVAIASTDYQKFVLPQAIEENIRQRLDAYIAYEETDIVATAHKLINDNIDLPYKMNMCLTYPTPNKNWVAVRDFTPGISSEAFIAANDIHFYFYVYGHPAGVGSRFDSEEKVTLISVLPNYEWDIDIRNIARAHKQ